MSNVVDITNKANFYFVLRNYSKNGPTFLYRVEDGFPCFVKEYKHLSEIDHWPKEYVHSLLQAGEEEFAEAQKVIKELKIFN